MESPSGRACEVIRKRGRARISSRIRSTRDSAGAGAAGAPAGAGLLIVVRLVAVGLVRGGLRRGVGVGSCRALRPDVVEDSLDAVAPLDRFVEEELQEGNPLEPEPAADLAAQEGCRSPERARRLATRLVVAKRRVIGTGDL